MTTDETVPGRFSSRQGPIRAADIDLHADMFGDRGDPAILLLAEPADLAGRWRDEYCSRLAAGLRFVIRYAGATAGKTATDTAADVAVLLTALDTGPAHIVGGTAGEQAMRRLEARHPDLVASITLISAGPAPGQDHPGILALVTGSAEPDVVIPAILRHTCGGADEREDRLTARSLAAGDPTGWFERFYRAGAAGEVEMPWARAEPHWLLTRWAAERGLDGSGRRAVVVGCGQGADAEYVAGLGFQTVAFDIAEPAIRLATQRYPDSAVQYETANLLDPPSEWWHAFDLVVEIITVQALPDPPQHQAIVNVGRLVGPGGTLLAVEAVREEHEHAPELGPWPLSRADINAFATDGLIPVGIDLATGPRGPEDLRWLAEFRARRRRPRLGRMTSNDPADRASAIRGPVLIRRTS